MLLWFHQRREEPRMTDYKRMDRENLKNVIRALRIKNKRQPTRATMAEIKKAQAALDGK